MNVNGAPSQIVPALPFDVLGTAPIDDMVGSVTGAGSGALPVADVSARTEGDPVWLSAATVDSDGRIAVRGAMRHLGWTTGRVTIAADPSAGALVVTAGGPHVITAKGMLRLPLAARRACELATGTQLLLTVSAERAALVAFTTYAVQRWLRSGQDQHEDGL